MEKTFRDTAAAAISVSKRGRKRDVPYGSGTTNEGAPSVVSRRKRAPLLHLFLSFVLSLFFLLSPFLFLPPPVPSTFKFIPLSFPSLPREGTGGDLPLLYLSLALGEAQKETKMEAQEGGGIKEGIHLPPSLQHRETMKFSSSPPPTPTSLYARRYPQIPARKRELFKNVFHCWGAPADLLEMIKPKWNGKGEDSPNLFLRLL